MLWLNYIYWKGVLKYYSQEEFTKFCNIRQAKIGGGVEGDIECQRGVEVD